MLDGWVKEDIVKEGCNGTYFTSPPQSSPLAARQGTAAVPIFFLEIDENHMGSWL